MRGGSRREPASTRRIRAGSAAIALTATGARLASRYSGSFLDGFRSHRDAPIARDRAPRGAGRRQHRHQIAVSCTRRHRRYRAFGDRAVARSSAVVLRGGLKIRAHRELLHATNRHPARARRRVRPRHRGSRRWRSMLRSFIRCLAALAMLLSDRRRPCATVREDCCQRPRAAPGRGDTALLSHYRVFRGRGTARGRRALGNLERAQRRGQRVRACANRGGRTDSSRRRARRPPECSPSVRTTRPDPPRSLGANADLRFIGRFLAICLPPHQSLISSSALRIFSAASA